MLELKNVDVVYHDVIQVLRSVNLEVKPAQIVTLLGGNGAGKTTTLRAISSLLAVEQGRVAQGDIRLDGRDIANTDPGTIVRSGLVQVLEGRKVLKHLSVEQNLQVGAHFRGDNAGIADDLEGIYLAFPKLRDMRARTAGYLSGGEMQMLLIGRALMARPRLLLLDEPSMGLAPLLVREIFAVIARLKAEGIPILLVEQNAHAALSVADVGYVLETGRIALGGLARELLRDERIKAAYLGL